MNLKSGQVKTAWPVEYRRNDTGPVWGPDLKKLTTFIFLEILALETYPPCCEEAEAALVERPRWRGTETPTVLPDESSN